MPPQRTDDFDDDDEFDDGPPPGVDENGDEIDDDELDEEDDQGTDDVDEDELGEDTPPELEDEGGELPPDPPGTERNAAGRLIDSVTKKLVPDPRRGKPGTPAQQQAAQGAAPPGTEQGEGDGEPPAGPQIPDDAEPFVFTADRQQYHIPGTYRTDDGSYVFTPQAVATMQRIAAAGQHSIAEGGREVRTLRQQIQELTTARSVREQELEAAHAELAQIMKDPAKLMEFADDLSRNWDLLQAKHRAKALEEENKRLAAGPQREQQERSQQEIESYVQDQLEKTIISRVQQKFADVGFTVEDLVPAYRTLYKAKAIFQAQQDIVENGQVVIRRGQWAVDWDLVDEVLEGRKELKTQVRTVATNTRKAAEFNARRRGVRTPPPAAGRGARTEGRGNDPATPRRAPRPPQTREEADALLSMPADEANARIGYNPGRRA